MCSSLSLEAHLVLTCHSATRLSLMAPFPSITTTLYAHVSLRSRTAISATFPSIPLPRITNRGFPKHLHLCLAIDASAIPSMLSCRKFVYFPSRSFAVVHYVFAEHTSLGDEGVQKVVFQRIRIEERVQGCLFLRMVLPRCYRLSKVERHRYA